MRFKRRLAAVIVGFVLTVCSTCIADAAEPVDTNEPLARLANRLLLAGAPGTLTAEAAKMFGLEDRDYAEKYVEVRGGRSDRIVEVVADHSMSQIFFSHQTGEELITVRLSKEGQFIFGLRRSNDTHEVHGLTGNQGRAFLETEIVYWLFWLTDEEKH